MFVLTDGEIEGHIERLDEAWRGVETFAFVPQRTNVGTEWVAAALDTLPQALRAHHFALLTSGSTGQPKLVIGEKQRAEALASVLHRYQDSEPVERTIVVLPLTYCYAFVNQWLWSRVVGRELSLTNGFSQPDVLKRELAAQGEAMLCMVGAQVPLLAQSLAGYTFPSICRLHFAGGRFPQDKLGILRQYFPRAEVYNNYGCAEAMPRLSLRQAGASSVGSNIGCPLPGVELRAGEADVLLFRSRYGSVGYVDGDGFHAVTDVGWVPTGDLARQQQDGSWELLGRSNEVFKRYGEKVSLPALQNALASGWPGQVAFYRETDSAGELGHVLVVTPPPSEDEVRTMQRTLRGQFSRAQWPLRIESVETLPLLPNGKIDSLSLSQASDRRVHWHQRI